MSCVLCGQPTDESLCKHHEHQLRSGSLSAEQLEGGRGAATGWWFVANCGAFVIEEGRIGRQSDLAFSILHSSVSYHHALLVWESGRPTVTDLESLNGTYRNGTRISQSPLHRGDIVRFGDIVLGISNDPRCAEIGCKGSRTTQLTTQDLADGTWLRVAGKRLRVVVSKERGWLSTDESSLTLTGLEHALVGTLLQRRMGAKLEQESFVASAELASLLEFRSTHANEENVRTLVRRVRQKLKAAGFPDIIESYRYSGYRIGGRVE